jgi:hypothetical protein
MRSFFLFIVLSLPATLTAQNFKTFRVVISGGYANGAGYTSGGVFGNIEPGYRLSDKIALGLRGELAGLVRGDYEGLSVNVDISKVSSYTINAIYYFRDDFVRPFAGVGAGTYNMSSIEYKHTGSGTTKGTGAESKFGFYPRIGIDLGHIIFGIDYNVVPKTTTSDGAEFKNNYLAIRAGVFFGGGSKNRNASSD